MDSSDLKTMQENKLFKSLKKIKLDGYKTYIVVALMIITVVLHQMGYISDELFNMLDTIFLALMGFSLRDAIRKK